MKLTSRLQLLSKWTTKPILLSLFVGSLGLGLPAFADLEEDFVSPTERIEDKTGLFIEYFGFEEYVYSQSRKTEIGDNMEVDLAVRYQFSKDSFGRLRFETDPVKERYHNKTSSFEALIGHKIGPLYFQIDSQLETNDKESRDDTGGGVTFGLDLDSELTKITYQHNPMFSLTFYPFNFDSEVGYDFNTSDVARVYYVDGAPAQVDSSDTQVQMANKTIPGLKFKFNSSPEKNDSWSISAAFGAATYLFPADSSFDILNNRIANRWERKEDLGYKLSTEFKNSQTRLLLEYTGHTEAKETGALLEQAASFYGIHQLSSLTFELEVAWSKAGTRPYRLSNSTNWFEITSDDHHVYSDINNSTLQEWVGEDDFAIGTRIGISISDSTTPYLGYKYQGEKFIYRERLSAHRLRTNDELRSHGGLQRIVAGLHYSFGEFMINPEFEYLMAKNPVFGNSSDVRNDRSKLTDLNKDDFSLFLTILYQFGGNKYFKP